MVSITQVYLLLMLRVKQGLAEAQLPVVFLSDLGVMEKHLI